MSKLGLESGVLRAFVLLAHLHSPGRLSQVGFRDDVVSLKNTARLVTADLHSPLFRDASPHHVSNRGPSEIVKEKTTISNVVALAALTIRGTVASAIAISANHPTQSGRCANLPPRLAEVEYWRSILASKHVVIARFVDQ